MIRFFLTLSCMLLLCACAGTSTAIRGEQYFSVEAEASKATVSIYMGNYSECQGAETCEHHEGEDVRERLYAEFERCLMSGMRTTSPEVTLMPREEWMAYPGFEFQVKEFLLKEQVDADGQRLRASDLPVDWVIVLEGRHDISGRQGTMDIEAEDGLIMMAFGQEWTKTSTLNAGIWKADRAALAADISATLSGDAFWMLPTIYIIPLVPFGWSPDVEGKSCRELGKALGRFFNGAGNASLASGVAERPETELDTQD